MFKGYLNKGESHWPPLQRLYLPWTMYNQLKCLQVNWTKGNHTDHHYSACISHWHCIINCNACRLPEQRETADHRYSACISHGQCIINCNACRLPEQKGNHTDHHYSTCISHRQCIINCNACGLPGQRGTKLTIIILFVSPMDNV